MNHDPFLFQVRIYAFESLRDADTEIALKHATEAALVFYSLAGARDHVFIHAQGARGEFRPDIVREDIAFETVPRINEVCEKHRQRWTDPETGVTYDVILIAARN